ncbi:fluoride efflux transporter CrcB [Deltaproteobacteria bacterium Smac51]|nr:fluoride efflux transporter CrcB [Deltaproteobacteria bacterium Smac51]
MPTQLLAVFLGGGTGAALRWFLSLKFNSNWPSVQIGTLIANLSGAFIIGLALAFFSHRLALPPEVRLFCVTGILGGLTTFSTFSSEVVQLIERGCIEAGLITIAANLVGSLLLTGAGLLIGGYLFK